MSDPADHILRFNLRFDKETREMLLAIACTYGVSMADAIRICVKAGYKKITENNS